MTTKAKPRACGGCFVVKKRCEPLVTSNGVRLCIRCFNLNRHSCFDTADRKDPEKTGEMMRSVLITLEAHKKSHKALRARSSRVNKHPIASSSVSASIEGPNMNMAFDPIYSRSNDFQDNMLDSSFNNVSFSQLEIGQRDEQTARGIENPIGQFGESFVGVQEIPAEFKALVDTDFFRMYPIVNAPSSGLGLVNALPSQGSSSNFSYPFGTQSSFNQSMAYTQPCLPGNSQLNSGVQEWAYPPNALVGGASESFTIASAAHSPIGTTSGPAGSISQPYTSQRVQATSK